MLTPPATASPTRRSTGLTNQLLTRLPPEDFRRLLPHLETIAVTPRQTLQHTGDAVRYVYFPNGGVYSVITVLSGGATIEACSVGDDGMIGVEAFLDPTPCALAEIVLRVAETTATVERLHVATFRRELERQGSLHTLVGCYVRGLLATIFQSTACNAAHTLHQRCCRWLLETEDRARTSQFRLTQDFLASLLGARRPTVTLITRDLQLAGLLSYTRGRVTIVDRRGIEARACECYRAVQRWRNGLGGAQATRA